MPPIIGNTTTTGENPAAPLTGAEIVRGVQSGGNVKMTTANIAALGYNSPTSAPGDLIVHGSGADQRLAVGADGHSPIADSTQPLGMRWGDALARLATSIGTTLMDFIRPETGATQLTIHDWICQLPFRNALSEYGTIQQAINAANNNGGGTVVMPVKGSGASYNLGTSTLTTYANVRLIGEVGRYAGSTTRGVRLAYSGTGDAILGQDLLDWNLSDFCVDITAATGTSVNGIHLHGAWKGKMSGVTVVGGGVMNTTASTTSGGNVLTVASTIGISSGQPVIGYGIPGGTTVVSTTSTTVTISNATSATVPSGAAIWFKKGASILIDTDTAAGPWGAQHNRFENIEAPDGLIALAGVSGGNGVTTTVMDTVRGCMYSVAYSKVTLINATAEAWPDNAYAYSYTGGGTVVNMIGCDIENNSTTAAAIYADVAAEWHQYGTDWNGYQGTDASRVTGNESPSKCWGGPFQFIQPQASNGTSYPILQAGIAAVNYSMATMEMVPVNQVGGSTEGFWLLSRFIAGVRRITHQLQKHAFIEKSITTSSTSAQTVWTIPVPNGRGLKLSVHAEGLQIGDTGFSNFRNGSVFNNGGALTAGGDTQTTNGANCQITFTTSGTNVLVNWTPTTANTSTANFTLEIRGPWTSYT